MVGSSSGRDPFREERGEVDEEGGEEADEYEGGVDESRYPIVGSKPSCLVSSRRGGERGTEPDLAGRGWRVVVAADLAWFNCRGWGRG